MEINLGEEKIVVLEPVLTDEVIRDRVVSKRTEAFGTLAKFLDRPRPDDVELVRSERRLESFWFARATALYRYDRRHNYSIEVGPEVSAVTINDQQLSTEAGRTRHVTVAAINHCVEEYSKQITLEPVHGEEYPYSRYLAFKGTPLASLTELAGGERVLVAPQIHASFVVRKLMQLLLRSIDADEILEERIDVAEVTLYLRPVHAFELYWKARDKRSVIEFDALTEEVRSETGQLRERVSQALQNDALFDIGADVAGMVIPGANLAIKLGRLMARKAIDQP